METDKTFNYIPMVYLYQGDFRCSEQSLQPPDWLCRFYTRKNAVRHNRMFTVFFQKNRFTGHFPPSSSPPLNQVYVLVHKMRKRNLLHCYIRLVCFFSNANLLLNNFSHHKIPFNCKVSGWKMFYRNTKFQFTANLIGKKKRKTIKNLSTISKKLLRNGR